MKHSALTQANFRRGKDMRATLLMAIVLGTIGWTGPADAQQKTEIECLDIVSKYLKVLTGTLSEAKPTGACPLAKWAKNRNEEILRMYSQEPAECRTTDLGKNLDKTLKSRISEEDGMARRHCRRN
jgi:hypothetical protein